MSLEKETKTAMGFKEVAPTCQNCRFMHEEEDPYLDRSWFNVCKYSHLSHFRVNVNSTCNCFKKKHER